jgi:hypothetical protein
MEPILKVKEIPALSHLHKPNVTYVAKLWLNDKLKMINDKLDMIN